MAIYKCKVDKTNIDFKINTNPTKQSDDEFIARGDIFDDFIKKLANKFGEDLSNNQIKEVSRLLKSITYPYYTKDLEFNVSDVLAIDVKRPDLLIKTLDSFDREYRAHKNEISNERQL